jgi:hypothetical protein
MKTPLLNLHLEPALAEGNKGWRVDICTGSRKKGTFRAVAISEPCYTLAQAELFVRNNHAVDFARFLTDAPAPPAPAPALKFVRVLRECGHNADRQARGENHGLRYDFDVIDHGEKTATFVRWAARYELYDRTRKEIKVPYDCERPYSTHLIIAEKIALFAKVYTEAKAAGHVPTAEQIAQREAADTAAQIENERVEANRLFLGRVAAHGKELVTLLKQTLPLIDAYRKVSAGDGDEAAADIRALLAKLGS